MSSGGCSGGTRTAGGTAERNWRTRLAEIDPGLVRLRLASIAVTGAIALAVAAVAAAPASGQAGEKPAVTAALAMVSNLAVNEPGPPGADGSPRR